VKSDLERYRSLSYWFDSLEGEFEPRPALKQSTDVDVAIVGAGYSGLWTAYYLRRLRPDLRVAIVEAEVAGFGASGRNGGWATAHLSGLDEQLAREAQRPAAVALQRAMFDAVEEIGRVCATESIDADFEHGGTVHFATNAGQRQALQDHAAAWASWGFGADDCHWLEPEGVAERLRPTRCLGGFYERHCAVLHPARLVRGLARAVESHGAELHEHTSAMRIEPGRVTTPGGELRAEIVVRATEGFSGSLPGFERALLPLHSWMIATEPLPDAVWQEIGLEGREAFGDARRITTYGQRTADGRLAFGARGTYEFGSRVRTHFDPQHPHFEWMKQTLRGFFPVLERCEITHHWGGPLGVPRSWRPTLGLERKTGMAWVGGYVGQGVAASNLAGRTLAELIAGQDTERTRLPWVAPPSRRWEPEPFRWLGVQLVSRAGARADAAEDAGRPGGLAARLFRAMTGR